jgi:hypothetical protein
MGAAGVPGTILPARPQIAMPHRNLKPAAVKPLLEGAEGWICLDVRTPEEFRAGHVAGAWNIPFALRDRAGRMAPNLEFVAVVKRMFPSDARLVLG